MIYNKEYKAYYYQNSENGKVPVLEYIKKLPLKEMTKVFKYIDFLRDNKGVLDEPYSKHIKDKIRELRVNFFQNKHRIFYVAVIERKIILLHSFSKKTNKTPKQEIIRAINNFEDYKKNKSLIEYEREK